MIRPLLPNLTELRNKLWKNGQDATEPQDYGQRQYQPHPIPSDDHFFVTSRSTTPLSRNLSLLVLLVLILSVTNAEEYSQAWTKLSTKINDQPIHTQETFEENKQGFLGCSFADNLCNPEEICFDDLVFGQCLPKDLEEDLDENLNVQRFPSLSDKEKALIAFELDELDQTGFDWNDIYTQCILQNLLSYVQYNSKFDKAECSMLFPTFPLASSFDDLLVDDDEDEDLFFPEGDTQQQQQQLRQEQLDQLQEQQPLVAEEIPEDFLEALESLQINPETSIVPKKIPTDFRRGKDHSFYTFEESFNNEQLDKGENDGYDDEESNFLPGNDEELENYLKDLTMSEDLNTEDSEGETPTRDLLDLQNYLRMRDALEQDLGEEEALSDSGIEEIPFNARQSVQDVPLHDVRIIGKRNNPTEFSPNPETGPFFYEAQNEETNGLLPQHVEQSLDNFDQYSDNPAEDDSFRTLNDPVQYDYNDNNIVVETGYDDPAYILPEVTHPSGGSVLRLPGGGLESSIFNRNERLDVKKPGPFYPNSANNFFLNKLLNSDSDDMDKTSEYNQTADVGQVEYEMPLLAPIKDKRDLLVTKDNPENILEPQFVHISLGKRFNTYTQGSNFVRYLAHEFGIPEEALDDQIIEDHHVQFKVHPNPQNINAHDMAKRIDQDSSLKSKIEDQVGVQIGKAAAGGRDDISSVLFPGGSNFNLLILVVVSVSAVAALLVVGVISLLVRRRARVQKIRKQDLQEEEKGKAQQEYQQLCRDWSRSSKKSDSKPVNVATSVKKQLQNRESKESEGSNRSSTSSCNGSKCEEPNTANMDISTGHMVLAYMEDHLKNKQRLEQEWVGLCGYEAEPCATTIAYKAENKKKNRYPDKLPYDHNRVILNAMVNASNSDYINASTVTDHDPRNPSYVVTQAPLANTVADFWQMIWEQGCVVIVMLTRLQDNGYQLCHRYWPEEGSEQYHIFEVHLVSEHVWCDDYLVRSVYLKNTRTGETRTVTQFHFLSWPAHGVPISTKALLEFRRKVNKSYRGRSCPIAVHCSDGVGRSGTYVLIDMVLNRMAKGCKEIDIAATLEHIRDQRGGMVQSRQQFEFCLMAVAEEVHAILKALPQ